MEWKKISEKPNYSVSEKGDIRNDKTGRVLKPHKGTAGYYQIMLGRKTSPLYVHRLVATAFLPNPENLPQVDHINGNKLDNSVSNLQWVSVSQNCWSFGYAERIEHRKKKVIATNGAETIIFNSRNEAAEHFQCHKSLIAYGKVFKKGLKKGWVFNLLD